jgi:hypothetical protein
MVQSDFIHRQTGTCYLTLTNGTRRQVLWDVEFGRQAINGHIFGNDEVVKLAAADGKATLHLSADQEYCVEVGPYTDGRAPIHVNRPVAYAMTTWRTGTALVNGHLAVTLEIDNDLRYLSAAGAQNLAWELLMRSETLGPVGSKH